jgi:hypothetical protein
VSTGVKREHKKKEKNVRSISSKQKDNEKQLIRVSEGRSELLLILICDLCIRYFIINYTLLHLYLINFYSGQFFYFIFYYFSIYFQLIFASFLFHFFLIFTITTIRKHIYLDHLNLNILTILLSHFFFGKLPIRLQPNNLFFDHTIIDLKHEHNYFLNLFPLLFFSLLYFFLLLFLALFLSFHLTISTIYKRRKMRAQYLCFS